MNDPLKEYINSNKLKRTHFNLQNHWQTYSKFTQHYSNRFM